MIAFRQCAVEYLPSMRLSKPSRSKLSLPKNIERNVRSLLPIMDMEYAHKAGDSRPGQSHKLWHEYLASLNNGEAEINQQIETLFDEWFRRFDPRPEEHLRKNFLEKLRTHNRLGDALCALVAAFR